MANDFENYFVSKIESIRKEVELQTKLNKVIEIEPMFHKQITPLNNFEELSLDVFNTIIKSAKWKYSSTDDIPSEVLKWIIEASAKHILRIVNISLVSGIFPNVLKLSHITPVIKNKKSDKNLLSNYRPINTISFLANIVEKCVVNQLKKHLLKNKLLLKKPICLQRRF